MPCVAILKRNGVKMPRNLAGIVGNALRCVLCRITELIDCHAVLQFSRVLATSHSRYLVNFVLVNVREKLGFMPQSISRTCYAPYVIAEMLMIVATKEL